MMNKNEQLEFMFRMHALAMWAEAQGFEHVARAVRECLAREVQCE